MKSVLEIAGYFLYLGSMCIILPIMLVLYLMLGCWRALLLVQLLGVHAVAGVTYSVAVAQRLMKHRWLPHRKWQLSWHLNKAS